MPMTCKNTDCFNTFLTTDAYWYGFCEDCYNEEMDKLEREDEDDLCEMQ